MGQDLREEKIRSEPLVEGILLHAFRDYVRMPDGTESVREWIKHPGAAGVVPLFEDGTTLLVRQFRYPPNQTFLEVPAGKFDVPGEDAEGLAGRELEEETGWKAGRLTYLGKTFPCIGYSTEVIHFFLGEDLSPGTLNLSQGEMVENVRMPFEEAVAMARNGEILDTKTAIALTYAARELAQRASR